MSYVLFERVGNIALVTLNDPDFRNAFGVDMATELFDVLMEVEKDESIRCMVLTGAGSSFCSGGKFEQNMVTSHTSAGIGFLRKYGVPVITAMKNLRCPLITALNGPAIGFGVGFSLMNDITYAAENAYYRLAFSKIGIVPDGGTTWILPRLIGAKRAAEMAMLDNKLSAEEAQSWGMVNRVFDAEQLMDKTMQAAEKLAQGPIAISYTRQALWSTWQNSFESQLELEVSLMHKANMSEDYQEGAKAFMEKREPVFSGK